MIRAAVLTISDKGSAGLRIDESGTWLRDYLPALGCEVVHYSILPDEKDRIAAQLCRVCDAIGANLVFTTGGTGLAPRDVTPEATRSVSEREVPGIAEAIRAESMKHTDRAMLSRGIAVTRGSSLIINLPGSPKAVKECIEVVAPVLRHAAELLARQVNDCAAER